ncbi:MAG: trehalase family glycosidase [Christensenellaceae bacterium]
MKESFRKTHEYITNNWQNAVVDATDKNYEWNLPFPFVPPCVHGLFRCLYYWDTFFTNKGMLADGKIDLAKNNAGDLLYMLSQKDYVPNSWSESGTTYCSQPPYLHFMVRDVYEATGDKEWLKDAYFLLKKEYEFWQTERMTSLGLNRHFHLPLSKEKLIAYYDYVTRVRLHVMGKDG